jgi:hypothetical protein
MAVGVSVAVPTGGTRAVLLVKDCSIFWICSGVSFATCCARAAVASGGGRIGVMADAGGRCDRRVEEGGIAGGVLILGGGTGAVTTDAGGSTSFPLVST